MNRNWLSESLDDGICCYSNEALEASYTCEVVYSKCLALAL
jgi:hypothetical protein